MSTPSHDQTRGGSTPFLQGDQPVPLSCNEAASLCMKAARGAGMSWGMAEEAGFAAAWLVSRGIDGPSHLRVHLDRTDGKDWKTLCPRVTENTWRNAANNAVCPLILGATLCDYADLPQGLAPDRVIQLGPVSMPILLTPFLAKLAWTNALEMTLVWANGTVCITDGAAWLGTATRSLTAQYLDLTLSVKSAKREKPAAPTTQKPCTTAATIAALNALAMRTTVPASEASRASAGSPLTDND